MSLLFGGTEWIQFLAALAIFHQDDLKKRMNRLAATWWKGCFGKMDDNPVHTIPNQHPTIRDVLLKTFVQIIIAVKWLVRHSSMNQQPGPFAFSSVFNPSSNM